MDDKLLKDSVKPINPNHSDGCTILSSEKLQKLIKEEEQTVTYLEKEMEILCEKIKEFRSAHNSLAKNFVSFCESTIATIKEKDNAIHKLKKQLKETSTPKPYKRLQSPVKESNHKKIKISHLKKDKSSKETSNIIFPNEEKTVNLNKSSYHHSKSSKKILDDKAESKKNGKENLSNTKDPKKRRRSRSGDLNKINKKSCEKAKGSSEIYLEKEFHVSLPIENLNTMCEDQKVSVSNKKCSTEDDASDLLPLAKIIKNNSEKKELKEEKGIAKSALEQVVKEDKCRELFGDNLSEISINYENGETTYTQVQVISENVEEEVSKIEEIHVQVQVHVDSMIDKKLEKNVKEKTDKLKIENVTEKLKRRLQEAMASNIVEGQTKKIQGQPKRNILELATIAPYDNGNETDNTNKENDNTQCKSNENRSEQKEPFSIGDVPKELNCEKSKEILGEVKYQDEEIVSKETFKDQNNSTDREKLEDEVPESDRVLRSSRRKSSKENLNRSDLIEENCDGKSITNNGSTVHLTDEGEIPVLHIQENGNADSIFDISLGLLSSTPEKKGASLKDTSCNSSLNETVSCNLASINTSENTSAKCSPRLSGSFRKGRRVVTVTMMDN